MKLPKIGQGEPCTCENGLTFDLMRGRRTKCHRCDGRGAVPFVTDTRGLMLLDGTSLTRLVARVRALPAWAHESEGAARAVQRARARFYFVEGDGVSGKAWTGQVKFRIGLQAPGAHVASLIVHEFAHVADGALRERARRGKRRKVHDRFFWSLWLAGMQDLLPGLREREPEIWANRDRYIASMENMHGGRAKWMKLHYALEWGNLATIADEWWKANGFDNF